MTPIFLIAELAKALREVVKDFEFVAELQPAKPVTVYEQYLPSDRFQVDTFYPLVIVSLDSVIVENRDRIATVVIQVSTFGGEDEDGFAGWRDMFNLAERICQFLDKTPILAGISRHKQTSFTPQETQPFPFFNGFIVAEYVLGLVQY